MDWVFNGIFVDSICLFSHFFFHWPLFCYGFLSDFSLPLSFSLFFFPLSFSLSLFVYLSLNIFSLSPFIHSVDQIAMDLRLRHRRQRHPRNNGFPFHILFKFVDGKNCVCALDCLLCLSFFLMSLFRIEFNLYNTKQHWATQYWAFATFALSTFSYFVLS